MRQKHLLSYLTHFHTLCWYLPVNNLKYRPIYGKGA